MLLHAGKVGILFFAFLFSDAVRAQNDSLTRIPFSPPVIKRCGTMEWDSTRRANDPSLDKWDYTNSSEETGKRNEIQFPPPRIHPVSKSGNTNKFDLRLLNYYSEADLIDLEKNNPQKYNVIYKYYTSSYLFEKTECSGCIETDAATFDVSAYESFRKKSERVIIVQNKYGFKLTLLAIDELDYTMPWFKNKK